jgi:hypothetical protein
MFEFLRKFSLLMILFIVGLSTYLTGESSTDWRQPLAVHVYPINGDGMPTTQAYMDNLSSETFQDIESFMQREAGRFDISQRQPVDVELGPELGELPPLPPESGNPFSVMAWSLKFRWWSYWITRGVDDPAPDIKLFLVYFDPEIRPSLGHSVGLRKGLLGIVNVFADDSMAETNRFVVAHEMLHTLGASDKYGAGSKPVHPGGYADPMRIPLYPQTEAEIMGGRIPISPTEASIPQSLEQVRVGAETAVEIRWLK